MRTDDEEGKAYIRDFSVKRSVACLWQSLARRGGEYPQMIQKTQWHQIRQAWSVHVTGDAIGRHV